MRFINHGVCGATLILATVGMTHRFQDESLSPGGAGASPGGACSCRQNTFGIVLHRLVCMHLKQTDRTLNRRRRRWISKHAP
ncbi:hypothetical protein LMG24238_04474 [Paraburkholderia sediminicola]|uniref:Uncharacterized protein n=1 Tax=Paraburkholderia sediminicola TaxID=458836 RepID=A0A6J5BTD9_9BURK|nr:hypothetical protein LMG24238_04474 [Paraburkholderia sediminicola]